MKPLRLKAGAPTRSVTDIGRGDYVRIGEIFEYVLSNTATDAHPTPRSWTIVTHHGTYGMTDIGRYAKFEDLEPADPRTMTLIEAERLLATLDWDNGCDGEFTRLRWEERIAFAIVVAAWARGKIDDERAATALHCAPSDLP